VPFLILIAFIAVPLVEIAVFIQVGGFLGLWPTLAIVILTAIAGTALLRIQGLATLHRAQAAMQRNQLPLREVFDGLCLLVAGALLLTPGFVTDALGGLLFLPPFRALLRRLVGAHLMARTHVHASASWHGGPQGPGPRPYPGIGDVIDGEFEEVREDAPAKPPHQRLPHDD
jgi:UPF0716 protein FxsA